MNPFFVLALMMLIGGEIFLKKGKEYSIQRLHPWVFSGAIQSKTGEIEDGAWVQVSDARGTRLGYGHYQQGSIAVRVLSFDQYPPTADFWNVRLEMALQLRENVLLPERTNAFRLVHGEGDGLSGLIIDYYNGVAVLQAHSTGMHRDRHEIALALRNLFKDRLQAIYYKSHGTLPGVLRDDMTDGYLFGEMSDSSVITEYGNSFYVNWEAGQKTGFFLDQRENRQLLRTLAKGRTVLNSFSYTGGFSVYALKGGAAKVHSVDVSGKATKMAESNIELNGFDPSVHSCYAIDTFDFLSDKSGEYDLIILDPPAFAKHRDARHQAVKGYQRLNAEAMRVIRAQGLIFTFSCSQVVDRQLFYDTVVSAAIQAGREIKVLHHLSQPADHPVSIFHPEGEYLKGLVLYVA